MGLSEVVTISRFITETPLQSFPSLFKFFLEYCCCYLSLSFPHSHSKTHSFHKLERTCEEMKEHNCQNIFSLFHFSANIVYKITSMFYLGMIDSMFYIAMILVKDHSIQLARCICREKLIQAWYSVSFMIITVTILIQQWRYWSSRDIYKYGL